MADIKLRNCPFCGGEAELVGGPEEWSPTFNDPDSGGEPYRVICSECGAEMAGGGLFEPEQAAEAWNRRNDNGR